MARRETAETEMVGTEEEVKIDQQMLGVGMVGGVAFGIAMGLVTEDSTLWLAVGLGLGVAVGVWLGNR